MPDIAMCSNPECPVSKTCRRHADSGTKVTTHWQSYADFSPDENGNCDAYWHVEPRKIK